MLFDNELLIISKEILLEQLIVLIVLIPLIVAIFQVLFIPKNVAISVYWSLWIYLSSSKSTRLGIICCSTSRLKSCIGSYRKSKDKILSQITVLQNKFTAYDSRPENIESRVSLIEEQSLISLETSASWVKEFLDCEKSDLLPYDRMILRNHKRVGKPNTD